MDVVTLGQAKADAKRYGRRQLIPCASRAQMPGAASQLSNGTDTGGTYRVRHRALATVAGLHVEFSNVYDLGGIETDGPNDYTITNAALETPAGVRVPLWFGGSRTVTVPAGATVRADYLPVDLTVQDAFWTWQDVSVAPGGKWPLTMAWAWGGENNNRGAGAANLADAGSFTGSAFDRLFGPSRILGYPKSPGMAVIGIVGDSIDNGNGDSIYIDARDGYVVRALGTGYVYQKVTMEGSRAQEFAVDSTRGRRGRHLDNLTALWCGYGVNDVANGRTAAQIQADLITIWKLAQRRGIPAFAKTITPKTTSTDGWISVGNQTSTNAGQETVRAAVNPWLRAGAPLDPATLAAVAVGTSGALIAGAAGHPLRKVYDCVAQVESAQDSGKWKIPTYAVASAVVASNVATITLTTPHNFPFIAADSAAVVYVSGVGTPFDGGPYTLTSAPTASSFTFALTAANTTKGAGGSLVTPVTTDGVHPTPFGHILMASALTASDFGTPSS